MLINFMLINLTLIHPMPIKPLSKQILKICCRMPCSAGYPEQQYGVLVSCQFDVDKHNVANNMCMHFAGYNVQLDVLNTTLAGIVQNRRMIFIHVLSQARPAIPMQSLCNFIPPSAKPTSVYPFAYVLVFSWTC